MECQLCIYAQAHGWWGISEVTHCRDCHRTWPRTSREAHCAACHRHFSSPTGFDAHFGRDGEHRDPFHKNRSFVQRADGAWYRPDPRYAAALGREGVSP